MGAEKEGGPAVTMDEDYHHNDPHADFFSFFLNDFREPADDKVATQATQGGRRALGFFVGGV